MKMDNVHTGLTYEEFTSLLKCICQDAESFKDYLSDLDSAIGDGDLGITISRGFHAVEEILEVKHKHIGQLLIKAGISFNNSACSTMGVLFGTALTSAGKTIGDTELIDLSAFSQIVCSMEESIADKGKAVLGEKTMLDAIDPVRLSLLSSMDKKEVGIVALEKAYQASTQGSETTREMQAAKGRSRWLGERTIGHLDPGAVFISLIMKSILDNFKKLRS
jgi:phosphoenolpyruvate---glycerone phosphotransferase subunit DhaL